MVDLDGSKKRSPVLQCSIVDAAKCLYLVIASPSGPGKPVQVQFKSDRNECTFKDCITARDLSYHHTADKNFICKHMKSIIHFKESGASLEDTDLFLEIFMKQNPDINENDVAGFKITTNLEIGTNFGAPNSLVSRSPLEAAGSKFKLSNWALILYMPMFWVIGS